MQVVSREIGFNREVNDRRENEAAHDREKACQGHNDCFSLLLVTAKNQQVGGYGRL